VLRSLTGLACVLFGVSVFFPFLSVEGISSIPEVQAKIATLWSFKATDTYVWREFPGAVSQGEQYWFSDYWRAVGMSYGGVWEGVIILMFATQFLTILSAVAAICLRDRFAPYWSLLSGIYGAVSVSCMWAFNQLLNVYPELRMNRFELGFWFATASAVLFLAVFIASRIRRNKPTSDNLGSEK
jgi:hypothetical protein